MRKKSFVGYYFVKIRWFGFNGLICAAKVGPISEKNLLNSLAIFRSPSTMLPFTQNFV